MSAGSSPTVLSTKSSDSSDMEWWDKWPENFDGTSFFDKVREGQTMFRFDVQNLLSEIEANLGAKVVDIPIVTQGSNNFGFELRLASGKGVLARVSRSDVNWPGYDGFPFKEVLSSAKFEAEIYHLLQSDIEVLACHLLFHRLPVRFGVASADVPHVADEGRCLFVFEKREGRNNVWLELDANQKNNLLLQLADIRTALFRFKVPLDFSIRWLPSCFPNPPEIPCAISPTRAFACALLTAKVEEVIKNEGDPIGWEDDHNFAGPVAVAAKRSLLQLIPFILPADEDKIGLYRLVLEHGDYGIHNMTINPTIPKVTSLFDWETAHIVPAILSDPEVAVSVNLSVDLDGVPLVSRVLDDSSEQDRAKYAQWAKVYVEAFSRKAPQYVPAIKAGKDVRHIWFTFKRWKGADPEGYFGALGSWAEDRLQIIKSATRFNHLRQD